VQLVLAHLLDARHPPPPWSADLLRGGAPAALAVTRARLAREHGRLVGVVTSGTHREHAREWWTGLLVFRRAKGPSLVLVRIARDGDQIARLHAHVHLRREQVTAPAATYATANRFRFPADGTWTILQGGATARGNHHHDHREQRWAYDAVVERFGRVRPAGRRENERYFAYGLAVRAPAAGTVVFARDGVPENVPGEPGRGGGNGVILDHGFGEFSALWHLRPGSVRVRAGERVRWGQVVGEVGNTGRSTQPHIHFHVSSGPPGTDPIALPARFSDVRVDGSLAAEVMPSRGQRVETPTATPPGAHAPDPRALIDL
jgi:murein DD-endopeptidase MepM/ murein hydrolase activator NlpD